MNTSDIELYRNDTPFLDSINFLNHAAIAPISLTVRDAIIKGTHAMLHEIPLSDEKAQLVYDDGRLQAAKLISCRHEQISYIQNTSTAMSMVAMGIDFKNGDNIVVPAMEFPSNYLPWLQLKENGVEVRLVETVNGRITADLLTKYVDSHTRLVALSHVQYYNGFRVDLAPISSLCHKFDSLLVVDGTQSAGAIKVAFERDGIDVFVAASHKWLMGPVGTGFMALSDRAMQVIKPRIIGWLSVKDPFAFNRNLDFAESARRFEAGSENCSGFYGLAARLSMINTINPQRIEDRLLQLVDYLLDKTLECNNLNIVSLSEKERSGIVLISHKTHKTELIFQKLTEAGIKISHRGDYIRVSPHYHNTFDEIDHLIDVVSMG